MAPLRAGIGKGRPQTLRIGTRGSPLALAQAEEVRARLIAAHPALALPEAVEIVVIKTTGDKVQDRPLAEIGGKGLFTKEIEEALIDGGIDLAVHSMKDVPTVLPPGLFIACLLPREDPRDALIAASADSIAALPPGARVGTASLRRQAQLKALRPDLVVVPLRGNVGTRLEKIARGDADATILALAGLRRLGRADAASAVLETSVMLPAVAQGAIGIEARRDDAAIRDLLRPLDHRETALAVAAERACLAVLEGSCRTPIAAHAIIAGGRLALRALVAHPDGTTIHRAAVEGLESEAEALGQLAGERLRRLGKPGFIA